MAVDLTKLLTTTTIRHIPTGNDVDAFFTPADADEWNLAVDDRWWCGLALKPGSMTRRETDRHWVWSQLVEYYARSPSTRSLLLRTTDRVVQAGVVYDINAQSQLQPQSGCLYINYIATAPHNREELVAVPQYKRTAYGTLNRLLVESYVLNLGGRLSLQSVPTPAAIGFYTAYGFVAVGAPLANRLQPMELPEQIAYNKLRSLGVVP